MTGERSIDPLAMTPYRAVRILGRGAMGQVWEAEHRQLGTRVAVKILVSNHDEMASLEDRMRLEARAQATLESSHLVRVTDLGHTVDGSLYLAMELLRGRTLDAIMKERGHLPVAEACDIILQALRGLAVAHEAGLVHRDIKPSNVFRCEPDRQGRQLVKIIDFGVARVVSDSASLARQFRTTAGSAVGTPRYMAPEQVTGGEVDARTDIYAVGVTLYRLLAGQGPFDHHHKAARMMMAQVLEAPEPPSMRAAQPIPAAVDKIVLRALEKNPDDRFVSAEAMAEALFPLLRSPAAPSSRPSVPQATEVMDHGAAEAPTIPVDAATSPATEAATEPLAKRAASTEPIPLLAVRSSPPTLADTLDGSIELEQRASSNPAPRSGGQPRPHHEKMATKSEPSRRLALIAIVLVGLALLVMLVALRCRG